LQYRYQQDILDRVEAVADHLPQIIQSGRSDVEQIDFLATAQNMLGIADQPLYSAEEVGAIRQRMQEIQRRILERSKQIAKLEEADTVQAAEPPVGTVVE
jgi:hypothetical protein